MKNLGFSIFAGGLSLTLALLSCTTESTNSNAYVPPTNGVAPPVPEADGQQLFVQNCASCHQKDRNAIGPALKGVRARWGNDSERLYAYIRNNVAATAAGDPRAVALQQKWGAAMPLFDGFSDAQIAAILNWVEL